MARIEHCVKDIRQWMKCNLLKLNDDKTEFIVFSSKHRSSQLQDLSINIGDNKILPVTHVKNLGITFDQFFTMEKHVAVVSKSCHFHLKNISRIRKYLTADACKTLVQALVISRLDYGNVLLYGLPKTTLYQLQRVHNTAARIVACSPRADHVTPILHDLHWLPVEKRITFKVILLTFKALLGQSPTYIIDMIKRYEPTRSLRSQSQNLLCVHKSKTATYGNRLFTKSAPTLWNDLPATLKNCKLVPGFKRQLKTLLFKKTYENCI